MRGCALFGVAMLATGSALAKQVPEAPPPEAPDSLAFCGAKVTALAWFYKGLVEEESQFMQQDDLDSLLYLRTELRREAIRRGEEHLERFDTRSNEQIEELTERITTSEDSGAVALAELNVDIRSCVSLFFEKQE